MTKPKVSLPDGVDVDNVVNLFSIAIKPHISVVKPVVRVIKPNESKLNFLNVLS